MVVVLFFGSVTFVVYAGFTRGLRGERAGNGQRGGQSGDWLGLARGVRVGFTWGLRGVCVGTVPDAGFTWGLRGVCVGFSWGPRF